MTQNAETRAGSHPPAADAGQARHGRTESQDPEAAAKRAEHSTGGDTDSAHEVRVRSNYQTPLGDVAAAADAEAAKDARRSPP